MKSELHSIIARNIATNRKAVMNYNLLRQQQLNEAAKAQPTATS